MVTILDRYLGARIFRPFGASIAIVIMLLSLENSARLIGQLNEVEQPLGVLMRFMGYLIPEYLGMGIVFAVFIGASMAFRGLALSGELDVFSAIGMSNWRLLVRCYSLPRGAILSRGANVNWMRWGRWSTQANSVSL
jgi:lipopolysaccharide export system permease protein